MPQDPERPLQTARPDAPASNPAAAPTTDESAAEDGRPSDMDYYRVPAKSGAMMMLGTIAIPLVAIIVVGIVVMIVR